MTQTPKPKTYNDSVFLSLKFGISNLFRISDFVLRILIILFILSFAWNTHAAVIKKAPNNDGLVGYWNFNEGTGSYVGDSSGNRNQGTLTNGPTWVDGKLGKGLSFDGSDDFVTILDSPSLKLFNYTQSLWFKTKTTANNVVIEKSNSLYFIFSDDPACGGLWMAGFSGNRLCADNELNDNQWHHIVITYTDSDARMYVDGTLNDNIDPVGNVTTNSENMVIGARSGGGSGVFWQNRRSPHIQPSPFRFRSKSPLSIRSR